MFTDRCSRVDDGKFHKGCQVSTESGVIGANTVGVIHRRPTRGASWARCFCLPRWFTWRSGRVRSMGWPWAPRRWNGSTWASSKVARGPSLLQCARGCGRKGPLACGCLSDRAQVQARTSGHAVRLHSPSSIRAPGARRPDVDCLDSSHAAAPFQPSQTLPPFRSRPPTVGSREDSWLGRASQYQSRREHERPRS